VLDPKFNTKNPNSDQTFTGVQKTTFRPDGITVTNKNVDGSEEVIRKPESKIPVKAPAYAPRYTIQYIDMKSLLFFLTSLLIMSDSLFCQIEPRGELIFAYDTKSDTLDEDQYCISLYFLNSYNNFYLVYEEYNTLEDFRYICRFGSNADEYFVFKSASEAGGDEQLIYWRVSKGELYVTEILGGQVIPIETSFNQETLSINCIFFEDEKCGNIIQRPIEMLKNFPNKKSIGNKLPPSLRIINKWRY
jgi:hypothetical protein